MDMSYTLEPLKVKSSHHILSGCFGYLIKQRQRQRFLLLFFVVVVVVWGGIKWETWDCE